jgi:hypothetical protein
MDAARLKCSAKVSLDDEDDLGLRLPSALILSFHLFESIDIPPPVLFLLFESRTTDTTRSCRFLETSEVAMRGLQIQLAGGYLVQAARTLTHSSPNRHSSRYSEVRIPTPIPREEPLERTRTPQATRVAASSVAGMRRRTINQELQLGEVFLATKRHPQRALLCSRRLPTLLVQLTRTRAVFLAPTRQPSKIHCLAELRTPLPPHRREIYSVEAALRTRTREVVCSAAGVGPTRTLVEGDFLEGALIPLQTLIHSKRGRVGVSLEVHRRAEAYLARNPQRAAASSVLRQQTRTPVRIPY